MAFSRKNTGIDKGQRGCVHPTRYRTMGAPKRVIPGNQVGDWRECHGHVHYTNCVEIEHTNTWNMSHTIIEHAILLVVSFIWFFYGDMY